VSATRPLDNPRDYTFEPTAAVAASRARGRFVDCSVCHADNSEYLFHKVGVRFVRCKTCGMVYVNPTSDGGANYFDIDKIGQFSSARDRELCVLDFAHLVENVEKEFTRVEGHAPKRTLLVGRWLPEFAESPAAKRVGLQIVPTTDEDFRGLTGQARLDWLLARLKGEQVGLIILHEFLEACSGADVVLERLLAALPQRAWVVATYSNAQSLPARVLRRYWPPFFNLKSAFYNTGNLTSLMWRHRMVLTSHFPVPTTQTAQYFMGRIAPKSRLAAAVEHTPVAKLATTLRTGTHCAMFRRHTQVNQAEKLSIVFPVFNEAAYVKDVLEALIAKQVKIEKEIIVVESNSTDGTRDIVRGFENRPGVRVLYEDKPRGKGHAVRTGLRAVTGTIVLIQDADFEYDLDDYDALLEPILQRRTSFVLGSRSLGLDDWKVRRFEGNVIKRFLLNTAQVGFAKTFNLLYQQNITDVNTMFKVFRAECIEGLNLESSGFDLDIELACKLVKNGNAPMEVPVNYVARGFDEGKKISFVRDAFPSYAAFFRYRFK